ncbi:2-oxo-4-hydroxy-4-carboxy-5-ureidoimidazoline decarboxylase [Bauldia sp.]|uniref:2-oxo-4-hydroxy-4-carboxy-5-ureidoimidazoline decarboxylase n=1 Tax=Bauldia sp. TaxID=2575872 RepID=UPI003BA88143
MTEEPTPIATVNLMDEDAFVEAFGDVAEHAPWVASEAASHRPFAGREAMIAAFHAAIGDAGADDQHALLNAHPDLAGRAAIAGELTADSASEQAGVGLDQLTEEEFARFSTMNRAYRNRHGIPFILAVRGATKDDILAAFEERLDRTPEQELVTALEQVCRIVRFRLEDRVAE